MKRNTAFAEQIPHFKLECMENGEEDAVMLVKSTSIRSLYSEYERIEGLLSSKEGEPQFSSREFDLFAFNDLVGRDQTLPLLSVHLFLQHGLIKLVNE